jgi:hypothetical protein
MPLFGATACGAQGEGTAAMYAIRLYGARLRWSKRRPYVIQRLLIWLVLLVVGATAGSVLLGVVSLDSLIGLIPRR